MEYIDGDDFIGYTNTKQMKDEPTLRYVMKQVITALHQMHKAGIGHRDIKPDNIMLTRDGKVKLVDLGYAVFLSGKKGEGYNKTRIGTPGYKSSEIVADKKYQTADVDIFALGVTMIICRVVGFPFSRASKEQDADYNLLQERPDLYWKRYESRGISPEFKQLVQMMIADEPSARLTMADVIAHKWWKGETLEEDQFKA